MIPILRNFSEWNYSNLIRFVTYNTFGLRKLNKIDQMSVLISDGSGYICDRSICTSCILNKNLCYVNEQIVSFFINLLLPFNRFVYNSTLIFACTELSV